MGVDIL